MLRDQNGKSNYLTSTNRGWLPVASGDAKGLRCGKRPIRGATLLKINMRFWNRLAKQAPAATTTQHHGRLSNAKGREEEYREMPFKSSRIITRHCKSLWREVDTGQPLQPFTFRNGFCNTDNSRQTQKHRGTPITPSSRGRAKAMRDLSESVAIPHICQASQHINPSATNDDFANPSHFIRHARAQRPYLAF